jgi:hypothetical protein
MEYAKAQLVDTDHMQMDLEVVTRNLTTKTGNLKQLDSKLS